MKNEKIIPFLPPLEGPTADEIAAAKAVLASHETAIAQQRANARVTCVSQIRTGTGCGAMHRVGDLVYVQTHYYISPHGCTGGDYYCQGEGQFVCPACGHVNRLYDSLDVAALKPYFASVENKYDC